MLLDAHCHIDLFKNPERVVQDTEHSGVHTLAMSNTPAMFEATRSNTANARHILPCLGIHPGTVAKMGQTWLADFRRLSSQTWFVGEVGIDGTFPREVVEVQNRVFRSILDLIDPCGHIISVHSRKAEEECLTALRQRGVHKAIFHWYSGPLKLIPTILERGYYFSVNPRMCLSRGGQKRIRQLPLDRILIETDGPFVQFNGHPASPSDIADIAKAIAAVLDVPVAELVAAVSRNSERIVSEAIA